MIRITLDGLREQLGQSVFVENRPGGNLMIGTAVVSTSKPDGYTFLVSDGSVFSINPLIFKELSYKPQDLTPVSFVARSPLFLAANGAFPAGTLNEMITYVQANPDKLNYGSIGVGSFHHLSMEALMAEYGMKMHHIPYKGSGETATALRAGHIHTVFASFAALAPAVKSGQIKLLAHNGARRSTLAPDILPLGEIIKGYDLAVLQGVFTRTGTPREIIERLGAALAAVVKQPEVVQKYAALGIEPVGGSPADMADSLNAERERVARIVKTTNLTAN